MNFGIFLEVQVHIRIYLMSLKELVLNCDQKLTAILQDITNSKIPAHKSTHIITEKAKTARAIYGVKTKRLKEQVRRNLDRFPPDFMFELTPEEKGEVVAYCDHLFKQRVYMVKDTSIVPANNIEQKIFLIRTKRVMLDEHLAEIYGVQTKNLNKAVLRNRERFPEDFTFQLTPQEWHDLRFQIGTSKKKGRGGRRYLPYAFTEHGAVMLASVLNSSIAIKASIQVVRAFVKLREILATHKELGEKLVQLEKKIGRHDEEIQTLFEAIRRLMQPPEKPRRQIGFRVEEPKACYGIRARKR